MSSQVSLYLSTADGDLGASADLALSSSVTAASVSSYRVTRQAVINNIGDQTATGVQLTVELALGMVPVNPPEHCVGHRDNVQVVCTLGELAGGASTAVNLTLEVGSRLNALNLHAEVSSDALDSDTENNQVDASLKGLFVGAGARIAGGGRKGGARWASKRFCCNWRPARR